MKGHLWQRLGLVPVIVLVLLLALPSVALADDGGGRFSIFESVYVGPGEVIAGDVGSVFSSVDVRGTVNGNVFSVFSSVNVSGNARVDGTVTSVFSSVGVRNTAQVTGDVTSVFSSVDTDATATILGNRTSGAGLTEGRGPNVNIDWGDWRTWNLGTRRQAGAGYWLGRISGGVFSALFLAAIGIVTVALFPRRVQIVQDTVVRNPLSSLGVGFLGLVLSLPLALVLLITCCGFFVVLFATFLATLLGLVAVGAWVGDRIMDRADSRPRSPLIDVGVGLLVIALILSALDMTPFINVFSGLAWFALFSLAFGAVLLSRFGSVPPVQPVAPAWPNAPVAPDATAPSDVTVSPDAPVPPAAPTSTPSG
jgi:hypothetical protein